MANILKENSPGLNYLHKFKVSGENHIVTVINVSDVCALERVVDKLHGAGRVDISSRLVINYESYAQNIGVQKEDIKPAANPLQNTSLIWMVSENEYPDKTQDEFLSILRAEANVGLRYRSQGLLNMEAYRDVSARRMNSFINIPSPEIFDNNSLMAPVSVQNGNNIHNTVKAVQFLDDYVKYCT